MELLTVLAALIWALSIAHYKWIIDSSKVDLRAILAVEFGFAFLWASLLMPWYGSFDPRILQFDNLFLFLFLILVALVHNYYLTRGLRRETLHEFELIDMLFPILTVVLAALVFFDERDPFKLTLALVASGAFVITHLRNMRLNFDRADRWVLFAVFLMAVEAILAKVLLELMSPVALYTVRVGIMASVYFLLFQPRLAAIPGRIYAHLAFNAFLGFTMSVLRLISIDQIGIVVTELIMLLTPVTLGLISLTYLKEQWSFRQGLAFVVIISCIVAVSIWH